MWDKTWKDDSSHNDSLEKFMSCEEVNICVMLSFMLKVTSIVWMKHLSSLK